MKKHHLKQTIKRSRFSRANLLVFALVFGAIGSYIIYSSFAAGSTKTWSGDADFNAAVSKSNVTVANGNVSLTGVKAGSFQPDGVHMFMTDKEAAQMKANIDDPSKPEIKKAYNNVLSKATSCGSAGIPSDYNDGLAWYYAMAGTGQCMRDSAIVYKYTGNKSYADKVVNIFSSWAGVDPTKINIGGPGRDEVMAMFFYAYDLTREDFNTSQTTMVQNWAQKWFEVGKGGMAGAVNSPWVDYVAWGNSGTWPMMVAYIGAVFSGNQANIDYVIKSNPIIVDEAAMEAIGNQRETAQLTDDYKKSHPNWTQSQIDSYVNAWVPYHTHCNGWGPNLPEIDPDVNGQPYTLKTALIGVISRDGEVTGDCRHSFWYATFTIWGLQIMADVEQHRHDTSVWGPSGDPWQYTNVPGGQPKLKLAYDFYGKFLGNHGPFPWGLGYDRDQYTDLNSSATYPSGPVKVIGDQAFIDQEMSHYNEIYARMEAAYNHYPSDQYLRDTVNATNLPDGFASNTNLNGRALNSRGDRWAYHFAGNGAVVGDMGPVDSSEPSSGSGTSYSSPGNIVLQFNASSPSHFSNLRGSANTPSGTSVSYEAQSSCNGSKWSAWAPIDQVPDGSYLRVRATLTTSNSSATPALSSVSVDYTAASACQGSQISHLGSVSFALYATSDSQPVTVPNGSSQLLIFAFNGKSGGDSLTSVTYGGQALTKLYAQGQGSVRQEVWYLLNPSTGTANLAWNKSGSAQNVTWGASIFGGVNQSNPFGTISQAGGTQSNTAAGKTLTLASSANESIYDAVVFNGATPTTNPTADSSQTAVWSQIKSTTQGGAAYADGDTSVTVAWTPSGGPNYDWAMMAVPLHSATTTPPPPPPPPPPPSPPVTGDIDGDSHVTVTDLSILLSHFSKAGDQTAGDLNADGKINILDLSILLSHYGS